MFTFCKPVTSKKRFLPLRPLDENHAFTLFEKAEFVNAAEWKMLTADCDPFLELKYLNLVERGEHTKLTSRYVIIYRNKKPCGIAYFQILDFKAETFGEILTSQPAAEKSTRLKIFENYLGSNKDEILLRLFTCGNNLVSGAHGFIFDKKMDEKLGHELLLNIIEVVSEEEKLKGGLSAILIKDFHEPLKPARLFSGEKYSQFFVEPNLIVQIPDGVKDVAAYTDLFSKKYRNRARSIFKSLQNVTSRDLDSTEIKFFEKDIYALYEEIFDKAKFKLIKLPADYFSTVKDLFKHLFTIKGFFIEGEMIAFSSSFLMPDHSVEAHYIGFKYALNHEYNLYQNILYSIIGEATLHGRKKVNLGRTAAEIKTTVGARPEDLICYIKPQNTISKIIKKPFIALLQPAEWIPRNPFKDDGPSQTTATAVH